MNELEQVKKELETFKAHAHRLDELCRGYVCTINKLTKENNALIDALEKGVTEHDGGN